ncbi:MAG: metal ABC transporter substrate-binding protein [Lachnospiraceae bacterium]|nr:metal ABC transporter substrate-binding protein [Lachnospiraceae bacterium]
MKKIISLFVALVLVLSTLSGCGGKDAGKNGKLSIVTTIFPEYDWVKNVLGDKADNAEITMLLDKGVDLHSYQPTAADILKISACDLFIYVGGESDEWVDDALKEAVNKNMVVINLLEVLGDSVKEEEMVEGMQGEDEEHDHDHDEDEDHDHEHEEGEDHDHDHHHEEGETEYDEHVWLSLRSASVIVTEIAEALGKIDEKNSEAYKKNAKDYNEKLYALDKKFSDAVDSAKVKTVLFGDRFPFRYFTDDYELSYYAAFVGCSAETEASFETITFLSKKVDELGLKTVLTIEGKNHKIAETIVQNTKTKDQKVLTMDSMQSTTSSDVEKGTTYLSIMEKNLDVLKEALK